jgi:hypothetical protein
MMPASLLISPIIRPAGTHRAEEPEPRNPGLATSAVIRVKVLVNDCRAWRVHICDVCVDLSVKIVRRHPTAVASQPALTPGCSEASVSPWRTEKNSFHRKAAKSPSAQHDSVAVMRVRPPNARSASQGLSWEEPPVAGSKRATTWPRRRSAYPKSVTSWRS